MKYFVCLIAVKDFHQAKSALVDFKEYFKKKGEITVIDVPQENYDFLYNSLIEKANAEKKRDA